MIKHHNFFSGYLGPGYHMYIWLGVYDLKYRIKSWSVVAAETLLSVKLSQENFHLFKEKGTDIWPEPVTVPPNLRGLGGKEYQCVWLHRANAFLCLKSYRLNQKKTWFPRCHMSGFKSVANTGVFQNSIEVGSQVFVWDLADLLNWQVEPHRDCTNKHSIRRNLLMNKMNNRV